MALLALGTLVISATQLCTSPWAYAVPLASQMHKLQGTSFVYPLMGTRTSSDFGKRKHPLRSQVRQHHHGVDLAAPVGSTIRSIAEGHVIFSELFGGYGNLVVIKHAHGLSSHYGHCDTIVVKVGQRVTAGEIIGTVGSTGRSTGPHLHFEIRRDGEPEHPERYLPGLSVPAQG